MSIDRELLGMMVCPETRQPLTVADAGLLARLNADIQGRRLRNRAGELVETEIREALVRQDRKFLYVVDDEIAVMLIEKAIEL